MPPKEKKKQKEQPKSKANASDNSPKKKASGYIQDNSSQGLEEQEWADKIRASEDEFGDFQSAPPIEDDQEDWADFQSAPPIEDDQEDWADFQSAPPIEDDQEDWADFQSAPPIEDDQEDWADFSSEESMQIIDVGIGKFEVASSQQKLFTKDLGDCVAVVGYTNAGDAAMYHVNIPSQCFSLSDEEDWDEQLQQHAEKYAKVKATLEAALGKGNLSYQFIVGSVWQHVLEKPDVFKNGKKWIQGMNKMFQKVFKGTYKGCNKTATWNPVTKQLTPG